MSFIESIRRRAAALDARIAFPESDDERILSAATSLANLGIARPVLILDPVNSESHAARHRDRR